jgi:hypothetical protein
MLSKATLHSCCRTGTSRGQHYLPPAKTDQKGVAQFRRGNRGPRRATQPLDLLRSRPSRRRAQARVGCKSGAVVLDLASTDRRDCCCRGVGRHSFGNVNDAPRNGAQRRSCWSIGRRHTPLVVLSRSDRFTSAWCFGRVHLPDQRPRRLARSHGGPRTAAARPRRRCKTSLGRASD